MLVGCYDQYCVGGEYIGKVIWSFGVEFCLIESLLIRGFVVISFCVLDMNYVFVIEIRGYNLGMIDYWCCCIVGQLYDNCDYNGLLIDYSNCVNVQLQLEIVKFYGFGVVWLLLFGLDFSVDYYDICIDNEVISFDISCILCDEVDCCLGCMLGGEVCDIGLLLCQDVLLWVICNLLNVMVQLDQVICVLINLINVVFELVCGLDLKGNWCFDVGCYGCFIMCLVYIVVLEYMYWQFVDDLECDICNLLDDYQWCSKVNGSIIWNQGDWIIMLYGNCFGLLLKIDGSGCIVLYMIYNVSVFCQFGENLLVGVIVNNLCDSCLLVDRNGGGWLFYLVGNYDFYGC